MKRLWWIVRLAVIVAASSCIFAPSGASLRNAQAEEGGGCNTSTSCARNSNNACYCPDAVIGAQGCNGCFVPNGNPGCESCSGGPALGD